MKLDEFDFYSDRDRSLTNRLRSETRFLCALYGRCFDEPVTTDNVWKMEVKLVAGKPDSEIRLLEGVAVVELHYNPEHLLAITPEIEKSREILRLLQTASERACDALSWPKQAFTKAQQCVLAQNLKNEWTWNKSKWSPDRKFCAEIRCEHEALVFRMHLQVRDRKDSVTELRFIEAPPDEFLFARYFGDLRWVDDDQLRWSAEDGEILWQGAIGQ